MSTTYGAASARFGANSAAGGHGNSWVGLLELQRDPLAHHSNDVDGVDERFEAGAG
ncbi:hypothetical protein ATK86_7391 [Nocardia fluminea]|uniref:Uncharacterized protein n=1 Tax=Nocardia fluminea TaxID=134984 RepID=A0A2N3V4B9_9NOCA|nr:hypothetical protein ATK86_7391 [Nocardia fluminea]